VPFSLPFEKGKKLTVIYGENGTGKSTICDAFDLLGNGRVGSLENRGIGRTSRYWPALNRAPAEIAVTLEATGGSSQAAVRGGKVVVDPESGRPSALVLRRRQILSLVEAEAGKRYDAIRRFVDVSSVEASEGALRDLIRDLKSRLELALARVQENEAAVRQLWETAGRPTNDPLSWAGAEARRDAGDLGTEADRLAGIREALARLRDLPLQIDGATQHLRLTEQALTAARERHAREVSGLAESAEDLLGILQAAQALLTKQPSPAVCPLCQGPEHVAELKLRTDERLAALAALREAREQLGSAESEVRSAREALDFWTGLVGEKAAEFERARAAIAGLPGIALPSSPAPADLASLVVWLEAAADLEQGWAELEQGRRSAATLRNVLLRAFETWRENYAQQDELARLIPRLEAILEVVVDERKRFTDEKLSAIAVEVGRLYEQVHPGEGLNQIALALDPKKRASLELGASFAGVSAAPQAYFSDSHLDTLGLCVFLALAGLDAPEKTILVLDDVLASVDEPHVERLIRMLYVEVTRFRHCVITTHYRPWKEKLRWGWLKDGQCQFVELTKWSPTEGLSLAGSVSEVEKLRTLLREPLPDPQLVAGKAGVVLEAALDFLTQRYECRVPRRPGGLFSLGDLLQAFGPKLREALRVEVRLEGDGEAAEASYRSVPLGPLLAELERIAQARNVFGCHFREISFHLLEGDAIAFGGHVLALMDALTDGEVGWPANDKSGSYWATSGETRRLHPLKRPS